MLHNLFLSFLQLKLAADLSMEAWYYNETFAAWEPLMESEETLNRRHLWQLELKVTHDQWDWKLANLTREG